MSDVDFNPATLAGTLHDARAFIHRFVRLTNEEATLVSIWTASTHAIDAVDYCPYLHITSPLPECGKSRLLEILETIVANPWHTGRVTAAVLMRKIDKEHPTLLLDESDSAFNGADPQYSEALRGLLNLGFHRRGKASVCVGQGANIGYKDFSVFGPKAIAGIGRLPATVESRSIPIALKRRMKSELLKKWRDREGWAEGAAIRERIAAVMATKLDALHHARPRMPDGLSDRAEDVLEPLFAIADLAGGEWPTPVREAALALMGQAARTAREADQHLSLELLADLQLILAADDADPEFIGTQVMLDGLKTLEDRPWPAFGKTEKPITSHALSKLLKTFEIRPSGRVRVGGGKPVAAYRRDGFQDAFLRYLGFDLEHRNNANKPGPETAKTASEQEGFVPKRKTAVDPDKHWVCSDVPIENPDHEGNRCCEGGPLQLRCKLCRQSPTYWQGRPN
jgi:Protein of unknown function (DUF3631)